MKSSTVIAYPKDISHRYGAGHWKDLRGFESLLEFLGEKVITIELDPQRPEALLDEYLTLVKRVIFYYSFWPELIKKLRDKFPDLPVHVRTVNAEALQHWHRSNVRLSFDYQNIRNVYGTIRILTRDSKCRLYVDSLLGISAWDNQNYWKYLPGKADIFDIPYYSPWLSLRPEIRPLAWNKRENKIVCLAGARDKIGQSQIINFVSLAKKLHLHPSFKEWSFEISPGIYKSKDFSIDLDPVKRMAKLDEPWDLLCSVKAYAILTPLGFGTKTTIVDALAAGCHVLVDKQLANRLPKDVRQLCEIVEMSEIDNNSSLLTNIQSEPAHNDLNSRLMKKNLEKLKHCFQIV